MSLSCSITGNCRTCLPQIAVQLLCQPIDSRHNNLSLLVTGKCRKQNMSLYITFINLMKAFDFVNREGLFKNLLKIGCLLKLQSLFGYFCIIMKGSVEYDRSTLGPFDIHSGIKQSCVFVPTLFRIFASLLKHAFHTTAKGVYLHTRLDSRLFNLTCIKIKTKVWEPLSRDMLLVDDIAVTTYIQVELQTLINCFTED